MANLYWNEGDEAIHINIKNLVMVKVKPGESIDLDDLPLRNRDKKTESDLLATISDLQTKVEQLTTAIQRSN